MYHNKITLHLSTNLTMVHSLYMQSCNSMGGVLINDEARRPSTSSTPSLDESVSEPVVNPKSCYDSARPRKGQHRQANKHAEQEENITDQLDAVNKYAKITNQ